MSGITPRLGLKTFDQTDPFLRTDFNDHVAKLDAYPGAYICTSGSRPTWGASQSGMRIFETDTRRELVWSGTAWREPLSAPPVWQGSTKPNITMSLATNVYYKMATFTVNRPGTLLVQLAAEAACESGFIANMNFRAQVDGADCSVNGGSSGFLRFDGDTDDRNASGHGTVRHWMTPVIGMKTVGVGSHNFGIHVQTTSDSTWPGGSSLFCQANGFAMLVNSTDT